MHRGHWQVAVAVDYASRERFFSATSEVAGSSQSTSAWVVGAELQAGLSERLGWSLHLPFIRARFENAGSETRDRGVGDLTLSARLQGLFGDIVHPGDWTVSAGATLPVGSGVTNPITSDRNFVSNTVDPVLAAAAAWGVSPSWGVQASLYARIVLAEDSDGTAAGSLLQLSAGVRHGLWAWPVGLGVQATGLVRGRDEILGSPLPSSGGTWGYLTPGVTWDVRGHGAHAVSARVALQLPVYRNVRGTQLVEDRRLELSLRVPIDRGAEEDHGAP